MALATKCPHCHTVFRVALDQLKLRGGIVRCGACNEIFDGNAALLEPAAPPAPLPPAAVPPDLAPDPVTEGAPALGAASGSGYAPGLEAEPESEFESEFEPELEHEPEPAHEPEFAYASGYEPGPEPDGEPASGPADLPGSTAGAARQQDSDFDLPSEHIVAVALDDVHHFDDDGDGVAAAELHTMLADDDGADDRAVRNADDAAAAELLTGAPGGALLAAGSGLAAHAAIPDSEPEFVRQANRREHLGHKARVVMRWGTPLLALLLLLQLGTTFRNPLAARYPALQPALAALCAPFGCKVELPMQIDALAVEQGELQTLADRTFSFATVLRNGSSTVQAWPHVELVLNDAADKPVLRRVFAPRDYLPARSDIGRGFGPRSEQPVKLYFELDRLKASGYHIAIFYP